MEPKLEIRHFDIELRAENPDKPNTLAGYAAKFNRNSMDLGGFTERIAPGAFTKALAGTRDIRALMHHDHRLLLGTRQAKTLRLEEDEIGLKFEIDVPDTSYGRDALVSVKRGDIRGMSFGFNLYDQGSKYEREGDLIIRTLLNIDLHEVTVTAVPAYGDTQVSLRVAPNVLEQVRALQGTPALNLAKRSILGIEAI